MVLESIMVDEVSCIRVVGVDMCYGANGSAHHTSPYDLMRQGQALVVRRGQPFKMAVDLNRPYDPTSDDINLIISLKNVETKLFGLGTHFSIPVTSKAPDKTDSWNAYLKDAHCTERLKIEICPPKNCIVGVWNFEIDTQNQKEMDTFKSVPDVYILFNPWCKEDQVFLADEAERQEYVQADCGIYYRGSPTRPQPCGWLFQQFEKNVLDWVLNLIKRVGNLPDIGFSNPIEVARALAYVVHGEQKEGVKGVLKIMYASGVWTRMTETNEKFTDPKIMTGSQAILQSYYSRWEEHLTEPVRYAQCWAFAALLITVCRALGLPCRPVTAYHVGYDTKSSFTIDEIYDIRGQFLPYESNDASWICHIFAEVWMKRPDLSPGGDYDGWNFLDGSPEREIDGRCRIGPASVKAVQKGEVFFNYDTQLTISMFNSEKMFWISMSPRKPLKRILSERSFTGHAIGTKAVDSPNREDITENYKLDQGHICKELLSRTQYMPNSLNCSESNVLKVELKFINDITLGSDFKYVAVIFNCKNANITATYEFRMDSLSFHRRVGKKVKVLKGDITIPKGSSHEVILDVCCLEYLDKMINHSHFNVVCFAKTEEPGSEYIARNIFQLRKPVIGLQVKGMPKVNAPIILGASFVNPLPVPLHNGVFHFGGVRLDLASSVKMDASSISPGEEVKVVTEIVPRSPGRSMVVAKFISDELNDVEGYIELLVE